MKNLRIFNIACLVLVLSFTALFLGNLGKSGTWIRIPSVFQPAIMLVEEPSSESGLEDFFKYSDNINSISGFHSGDNVLQLKQGVSSDLYVIYYSKISFAYVFLIFLCLFILSLANLFYRNGLPIQKGDVKDGSVKMKGESPR